MENEPLTTPTNDWPRFMILTYVNPERPIGKLSPFAIHKGILGIAGVVKDVKKLRSGEILVEGPCRKPATCYNFGGCRHEGPSSPVSELQPSGPGGRTGQSGLQLRV